MSYVTPYFIIVGGMKAGTTSLHHFLMEQNGIYMKKEEVHFFNNDQEFLRGESHYMKMLGVPAHLVGKVKVGDDTPTYSYLENIPKRIAGMCPAAKIIWILRDPIDRAVSQYWHAVKSGIESRPINTAFQDELMGRESNIFKMYVRRSRYLWQIQQYLEYFDSRRMLFVDFHKFSKGEPAELAKISDFLEIDVLNNVIPHSNKTTAYPRPYVNKLIPYLLRRTTITNRICRLVRVLLGYRYGRQPQISPDLRQKIQEMLAEDSAELYRITGVQLT